MLMVLIMGCSHFMPVPVTKAQIAGWELYLDISNKHTISSCEQCNNPVILLRWRTWTTTKRKLRDIESYEIRHSCINEIQIHKRYNDEIELPFLMFKGDNVDKLVARWNNRVDSYKILNSIQKARGYDIK